MRMCVCSVLLAVKHFPQISQVNGFSPVDTGWFQTSNRPRPPGVRHPTCVSPQVLLQLGGVHEAALTLGTLR